MKICTLIVRLIGLYLFIAPLIALFQVYRMNDAMGGMRSLPGNVTVILVLEIVVGLLAAIFAGKVARLLTFDAGNDH